MLINCTSDQVASELSQNTITVTFSAPVAFAQSVIGEYFVEPCTVSSVSPAWDGTTNGAMVNPDPASAEQGYDNRAGMNFAYNGSLRSTFPLVLADGDTLVMTRGKTTPGGGGGNTHISDCMILTCVATLPADHVAFRPPIVGTSKTIWTTADVNYGLLPGLAVPSGATLIDMSPLGLYLNKTILTHGNLQTSWAQIVPSNHCGSDTSYPYEWALQVSRMCAACLLDIPEAHSIANRLIQYGIDLFPNLASNGDTFARQGGFAHSKWVPIEFTKIMLGEAWTIPEFVTGSSGMQKFQEQFMTYLGDPGGTTARFGAICDEAGYPDSYSQGNHLCRAQAGDLDQWELYYLDGQPQGPGGGYEYQNVARAWPGQALMVHNIPGLAAAMAGSSTWLAYVDRWVTEISENIYAYGVANSVPELLSTTSLDSDYKIDANKFGGVGGSGTGQLFMKKVCETYRQIWA